MTTTPGVRVRRTGPGTFTASNERGAQVVVTNGDGPSFTPGELLKAALAACTAVTAEASVVRALGPQAEIEVTASGTSEDHRFPELVEELVLDLSGLDEETRARLVTVAQRAVARACTVARTLEAGAQVRLELREDA
jgi:Predicted redox protein, regulator of disulfide bond formation